MLQPLHQRRELQTKTQSHQSLGKFKALGTSSTVGACEEIKSWMNFFCPKPSPHELMWHRWDALCALARLNLLGSMLSWALHLVWLHPEQQQQQAGSGLPVRSLPGPGCASSEGTWQGKANSSLARSQLNPALSDCPLSPRGWSNTAGKGEREVISHLIDSKEALGFRAEMQIMCREKGKHSPASPGHWL